MSIHDGHRARKKEQFLRHGLDAFADHEVLELLLFYALPRQDTNEIAHRLMARFGSLEAVFSADVKELCTVEGVGEHAATLLALMLPLNRRIRAGVRANELALTDSETAGAFFCDLFFGEREEQLYAACLDAKGRLLANVRLAAGRTDMLNIDGRRVVEIALSTGAVSVILSHNHPSGVALPSEEDRCVTREIARALDAVRVRLTDHIIVGDDDFVSLRDSGEL